MSATSSLMRKRRTAVSATGLPASSRTVPEMVNPPSRPILLLLLVGFGLATGLVYGTACIFLDGNA